MPVEIGEESRPASQQRNGKAGGVVAWYSPCNGLCDGIVISARARLIL